jgi:hypothetical protein
MLALQLDNTILYVEQNTTRSSGRDRDLGDLIKRGDVKRWMSDVQTKRRKASLLTSSGNMQTKTKIALNFFQDGPALMPDARPACLHPK